MARFPLTPDGVNAKQEELYKLDDKELINQAVTLSRDARAWIFENFELTEEQAAYYNALPEDFNYYLGWQMASNVIGRQPITMEPIPAEASKASNSRKKTTVSVSGNTNYNPQTGAVTYGASVSVGFTF
ncbi:hypothetical protein J2810_002549 [Chryseobacterium rhizosphaerae]|uniref:hypothetical protein n=1 Tax=Chryseobacterium rhizosphaerae TaxID=395937 RepID=UPI00285482BB|nr:hypothetical protein [Chryseobacterium rhizosphaerae]MDR6546490.1 hypothetical protein [Chryseobacterium rhizosphaerae]